jgi:hypothetical protein
MSNEKTIGSRALEAIAEVWRAEEPRLRWGKNGFVWWPGDFKVEASAYKRADGYVPETWLLTVRTDFLKDAPVDDRKFVQLTAATSRFCAPTFGWVYPTKEVWAQHGEPGTRPRLWLSNTAYVTAENVAWLPGFVALMSIMQPINAQIQFESMPTVLGGGIADRSRPDALAGFDLHEMLWFADHVYAPIGKEPNRWIGTGEFQRIVEKMGTTERSYGNADEGGLTIETAFGSDTALIRLRTDDSHPALGTGLLATLQIPMFGNPQEIADECAGLNFLETMWTDIPQLGCWHPHASRGRQEGPTFASFVPNALYQPGPAYHLAAWMIQRARWLREERFPNMSDKSIDEIMRARLTEG